MTGDSIATLLFLLVLLTVIGGTFFVANRPSIGQTARTLGVWFLLFVGLIVAYGLWDDVRSQFSGPQSFDETGGAITVPRQRDGHFHLTLIVNETPVRFIVDTGATDVVLSDADARRVGLNPDELPFFGQAMTANGPVDIARVTLNSVTLGSLRDENVRASVNSGAMNTSLLGMSYLNRFDTIQIQNGELTLIR